MQDLPVKNLYSVEGVINRPGCNYDQIPFLDSKSILYKRQTYS